MLSGIKRSIMTAGFVLVLVPFAANASPPRRASDLDGGAYLQLSPGPAALIVDQHKFASDTRWAWPWSLGAGWMFTRGVTFKATVGGVFEHRLMFRDDATVHGLQGLLEARIGGGSDRVWGYGLLGTGGAATVVDWKIERPYVEEFGGLVVQFGGGVQLMVSSHFFVGGELDLDLGWYFPSHPKQTNVDRFHYHMMTIDLTLGWHF